MSGNSDAGDSEAIELEADIDEEAEVEGFASLTPLGGMSLKVIPITGVGGGGGGGGSIGLPGPGGGGGIKDGNPSGGGIKGDPKSPV